MVEGKCIGTFGRPGFVVFALLVMMNAQVCPGQGARARVPSADDVARQARREAGRLIRKASDLLDAGEHERGEEMLKTVVDRWPNSDMRFDAWLLMGKHYMNTQKWLDAVRYLAHLKGMKKPKVELEPERLEMYLEALYRTGVCYYQVGQYDRVFPVLRAVTQKYPNSVWANQAYYYIGMCHFESKNWARAVDAFSMVGTFIDPESPTAEFVDAGKRLYIKLTDKDLPVLRRLGRKISASVRVDSGDKEKIEMIPLSQSGETYIGSLPTEVGVAKPGNHVLEVVGGDTIHVTYLDDNTESGEHDLARTEEVKVVSNGAVQYTLATYTERTRVAYLEQPLFVRVFDADLDVSPRRDKASVTLQVRYPRPADEARDALVDDGQAVNVELALAQEEEREEDKYVVRDSVTLELTEQGSNQVVRTGVFGGSVHLSRGKDASIKGDPNDDMLACFIGDEIIVSYIDARHVNGTAPLEQTSTVKVSGEVDTSPIAKQNYVSNRELRARKSLVEAKALLELGRIFRDMGLMDGAGKKCREGIGLVDDIISEEAPIGPKLREEAFRLKWDLCITQDDLAAAVATCEFFAKQFPDSRFVDEALLRIGDVHLGRKNYDDALNVYRGILTLPNSLIKAEAQYKIAEVMENMTLQTLLESSGAAEKGSLEEMALMQALPFYRKCVDLYPDSAFAGKALSKVLDGYIQTKDFAQAEDLLERVMQEYPDAAFRDQMLLKWVLVASRRGDMNKSFQKCQQLIFEHPESPYTEQAKKLLPVIRKRLGVGAETSGE